MINNPKCTQEYMKVADVINSCESYNQTFIAEMMIILLNNKHDVIYDSLYTMLYEKCHELAMKGCWK